MQEVAMVEEILAGASFFSEQLSTIFRQSKCYPSW